MNEGELFIELIFHPFGNETKIENRKSRVPLAGYEYMIGNGFKNKDLSESLLEKFITIPIF